MHCNECRTRLPEHLYGDLDKAAAKAINAHLVECDDCRTTLAQMKATTDALDAWSPVESSADARLVAAASAIRSNEARRSRLRRRMPWLGGLAAGVVLFVGLSIFGTEIDLSQGQLVISFGGPATSPQRHTDADLLKYIRDEVSQERALTLEAIEGALQEWRRSEDDRYRNLVHAVQTTREADQHLVARAFEGVAEDSRATRAAIDGVIRFVAFEQTKPFSGHTP